MLRRIADDGDHDDADEYLGEAQLFASGFDRADQQLADHRDQCRGDSENDQRLRDRPHVAMGMVVGISLPGVQVLVGDQ